jgi:hypothetical protein
MDELIPAFRQSIFNDSLADGVANIAEVGIDSIMSDGLLKDIPIVNLLLNASRTFKAIHERNLLKNTALFLDAVNSQKIDDKKVQAYKKKLLNEKTAERELGRVIVLLDQYVDNIKAQMLGKLFCQYIDRDYSWDKFCELSDILNRLFLDDMPFLYSIFGSEGRQAIYHIYKIPYNIKRLESIGLVELFGEYSSFGDRLLLSENMFAELTDNGLLFADVGSGLFKDTIQPQENFEKQSG